MANRPVHFIWLLDCSYSMQGEKIGQLNYAIREAIPEMRSVAHDNPAAQLLLRTLTFSTDARWLHQAPVPVDDFTWQNVQVDGMTNLGEALEVVSLELRTPPMPQRALKPVLALVSDGVPTDDWKAGLKTLDATPWGRKAVRVAIAIGADADRGVLQEFLGNPELQPLDANSPKQLAAAIRWASTAAVKAASQPVAGSSDVGAKQSPYAPPQLDDDDDDVW
ncbi:MULTISPECIES: tellurium resistance protein [unclassified Streptomyces]|uniref:vWA domain-containing protein n=1 Tax=unclassified Streptomyces TaxID=2593676 RepID=UPI00224E80B1|nr:MULTISPECIES: tellurium resistance protein [unclassified Streptomyces]MCX4392946.1 tellurium resistance protein [Streptomyces sp. NBC_01767]WSC26945.1 tellurium resistance protein [Streptomyces sp. NBC_01768]